LYLRAPAGEWQPVTVTLSGCPTVSATGFRGRLLSDPLSADLAALAPPPWQQRLR
jgi:hypothetical protein